MIFSIRQSGSERGISRDIIRYCLSILYVFKECTSFLILLILCTSSTPVKMWSVRQPSTEQSGEFEEEKACLRNKREIAKCRLMLTKVLGADAAQMGGVRKIAGSSPERRGSPPQYGMLLPSNLPEQRPVATVRATARFNQPAVNRALKEASDKLDVQLGIYGIQFAERTTRPSPAEQQGMLLTLHLLRRQAAERDLKATLKKIGNAEKELLALEKLSLTIKKEDIRRQRYRARAWRKDQLDAIKDFRVVDGPNGEEEE